MNGIEEITNIEELFSDEPAMASGPVRQESAAVTAAAAIEKIVRILENIPSQFHEPIFNAVESIRRTASGESVQQIGEKLTEIERGRRERAREKRGWFKR